MTELTPPSETTGRMTLMEHLEELRRRLISSIVALGITTMACFAAAPTLFNFLRLPLEKVTGQKLVVLGPMEMFMTYLKLSILAGVFAAAPWILYQVWLFVSPGLYRQEKRWILPFVFFGTAFFVAGGAFNFFLVLPQGFQYLVALAPETVETQYSVGNYFNFVVQLTLAFGLIFELPLIMWVLSAAGVVAPASFAKFRKYWIVLAFVIGGILTPPDPFSQFLMAIPLLLFFELGILGGRLLHRRRPATTSAPV